MSSAAARAGAMLAPFSRNLVSNSVLQTSSKFGKTLAYSGNPDETAPRCS